MHTLTYVHCNPRFSLFHNNRLTFFREGVEQSEGQRFMPYMRKPLCIMGHAHPGDERKTSIGTNHAPSDRCLGTAQGASRPRSAKHPREMLRSWVPNNGERCRGPDPPILWKRDPGSEVPNFSEGCHGPDLPTNNERYPGVEVLGGSPRWEEKICQKAILGS